jgi:hypothetical protein
MEINQPSSAELKIKKWCNLARVVSVKKKGAQRGLAYHYAIFSFHQAFHLLYKIPPAIFIVQISTAFR